MLGKPGYYFIMLEIGTGSDIHDEKTKLLPMSVKNIKVSTFQHYEHVFKNVIPSGRRATILVCDTMSLFLAYLQ